MGNKGQIMKEKIKKEACQLFAEKGYRAVTMKDICERTGLSRGGLYRHYDGTGTIFEEIFRELSGSDAGRQEDKMKEGVPAAEILNCYLNQMKQEMMDSGNSLSLAIYEYADQVDSTFFAELNQEALRKWRRLFEYGIRREEFPKVDIERITDLILYSYQGVRMWSRVIPLEESTADHIIESVKLMLEVD